MAVIEQIQVAVKDFGRKCLIEVELAIMRTVKRDVTRSLTVACCVSSFNTGI
ncbi:hypothetical protein ACLK17_08405 [Escherichia coli]